MKGEKIGKKEHKRDKSHMNISRKLDTGRRGTSRKGHYLTEE
jgi:hypothetical protein